MSNGYFLVYGEAGAVTTLLKLSQRESSPLSEEIRQLLQNFADLRDVLTNVYDLGSMKPDAFLQPFLDVIMSQKTNDVVTSRALLSINKFIKWNLIPSDEKWAPAAVESIALSVTETKYADSEYNKGDGVVFRLIDVLHSLLSAPCGRYLTNERVCSMLHTLFRVNFDLNLNITLRMAAETALVNMTRIIFSGIPSFTYDAKHPYMKRLVVDKKKEETRAKSVPATEEEAIAESKEPTKVEDEQNKEVGENVDEQKGEAGQHEHEPEHGHNHGHEHVGSAPINIVNSNENIDEIRPQQASSPGKHFVIELGFVDCAKELEQEKTKQREGEQKSAAKEQESEAPKSDESFLEQKFSKPVEDDTFSACSSDSEDYSAQSSIPYGLPCARELLRFSVSLTNPLDSTNQEHMITVGLNLVAVALETSVDFVGGYPVLMPLIKDDLCKSLIQLLNAPKFYVCTMANRLCFLLFESLRQNLKFQLERYFRTLMEIVGADTSRYERKEMALEAIVHLFRVPNLAGELYLNYDCGLYCTNLFEDLTKLLSENAFPTTGIIQSTHVLSLEALLTIINKICANSVPNLEGNYLNEHRGRYSSRFAQNAIRMPSMSEVIDQKKQKKVIGEGTDLFNKKPKKGINYLCEHGIFKTPMDPHEVAMFLRENPHLDKAMIGECIGSRDNSEILSCFVESFPFENTRLDVALRMFVEAFRLPGEAQIIDKILDKFSDHWYKNNSNSVLANADAANILAFAVVMLNSDLHNRSVKTHRQMSLEDFKKNLRGTNSGSDFEPSMLDDIYNEIKHNEIIMPSEQTGAVRENYIWKVLMKRSESSEGNYIVARMGCNDRDLFNTVWGPATAALSYIFERSEEKPTLSRTLNGYSNCATVAAYYGMTDVFDNLVIHLCKFSTLMSSAETRAMNSDTDSYGKTIDNSPDELVYAFGENQKAQMATKLMFDLIHKHGDHLRAGWKNVIDCVLTLLKMQVLPQDLIMVEDYVDPRGMITVQRPSIKKSASKQETSLMRWFGFSGSDGNQSKNPTEEQEQLKKTVIALVKECQPEQLIVGGRTLTSSALDELVASLVHWSFLICGGHSREDQSAQPPSAATFTNLDPKNVFLDRQDEDTVVFLLELMVSIVLGNKYRINQVWPIAERHFRWILAGFGRNLLVLERAVVGLIRVANKNLFRLKDDEPVAQEVLCALSMLVDLPPPALFFFSKQISFGLYQLLRINAANLHECEHWRMLFILLQSVGAAHYFNPERTLDDGTHDTVPISQQLLQKTNSVLMWRARNLNVTLSQNPSEFFEASTLTLVQGISRHDPDAFLKVCETLSFLVQDAVHITPFNFDSCTECLRAMVEAAIDGGQAAAVPPSQVISSGASDGASSISSRPSSPSSFVHAPSVNGDPELSLEQQQQIMEQQERETRHEMASEKLAALCATMVDKANKIQKQSADGSENSYSICVLPIYSEAFRMRIIPLLQALAKLTCDSRKKVRDTAFADLQAVCRTFEYKEMWSIDAEHFFAYVVLPLLRGLKTASAATGEAMALEELKVRAMQWAIRMVLHQLELLSSLPSFPILIMMLIMYMQDFLRQSQSDISGEAILQSLKNMIQVLDNSHLFEVQSILKEEIKNRLATFAPGLVQEIFAPLPVHQNQTPTLPTPVQSSSATPVPSPPQEQIPSPVPSSHVPSPVPTTLMTSPNYSAEHVSGLVQPGQVGAPDQTSQYGMPVQSGFVDGPGHYGASIQPGHVGAAGQSVQPGYYGAPIQPGFVGGPVQYPQQPHPDHVPQLISHQLPQTPPATDSPTI